MMNYRSKIIVMITAAFVAVSGHAFAQELSFGGKSFTVYYAPDVDLKRVERALRCRYFPLSAAERERFVSPAYSVEERICARLESLLKRVKTVLAMDPENVNLNVRIYKTREGLKDEYYLLFNTRANYKSFYVHRLETIYTSAPDISDTILIHELGHAVVDHYFHQLPPTKIAEMLANFADQHLEE